MYYSQNTWLSYSTKRQMDYCIKVFHDIMYLVIYQYDNTAHAGHEVLRIPIADIMYKIEDFKELIR